MGTFSVAIEVGSEDRKTWRSVDTLVDTGAAFTWLPRQILEELGYRPVSWSPFELADGRTIECGMTEVPVRIDGKVWSTICVFAGDDSRALLGAVTLEQFLLAPDPVHKRLTPVIGLATKAPARSMGIEVV